MQLGAVVISIDYTKSPRYLYPHALLQAFEVLTWAFSLAAQERRLNVVRAVGRVPKETAGQLQTGVASSPVPQHRNRPIVFAAVLPGKR